MRALGYTIAVLVAVPFAAAYMCVLRGLQGAWDEVEGGGILIRDRWRA